MGQGSRSPTRPIRVLVTGGGTIAPIDDVRQITNVSTGSFSAQITEEFLELGAEVWHLHTPSAVLPIKRLAQCDLAALAPDAEFARLRALQERWNQHAGRLHLAPLRRGTVAEYAETLRDLLVSQQIDAAMLAMAVSDYEPVPLLGKQSSDLEQLQIVCTRTPKVIRSVRGWSPDVFLVGFKLMVGVEVPELIKVAREACRVNEADLTVANDLNTLRAGQHTVHVVDPHGSAITLGPTPAPAAGLAKLVLEKLGSSAAK